MHFLDLPLYPQRNNPSRLSINSSDPAALRPYLLQIRDWDVLFALSHKQARSTKLGVKSNTAKGSSCRRKMWFIYGCDEEEKELGRQQAPGSCPYCGAKVEAMDVEIQSRLCFLPLCFKIKRKYFCTHCARRLELYY
ncbi:hypothetical protein E2542_SST18922 [Spatholobus suberectus]|nr:hypothetical protein E2542_SST18922 [Spatholobus suberectus]